MLLLSWLLFVCSYQLAIAGTSSTRTPSRSQTTSTCPSRTVNYITHSLPQQCLASTRKQSTTTPSTSTITPQRSSISTSRSSTRINTQPLSRKSSDRGKESILENSSESRKAETQTTKERPAVSAASRRADLTSQASLAQAATEDDAFLEDGKFLSFEEWRRQNLRKAGQSEHVSGERKTERETRKRPTNIHAALDSLGDDAEIDLDFGGFDAGRPEVGQTSRSASPPTSGAHHTQEHVEGVPQRKGRSKDAGTTSKERFNFASFDCAANVLKTNPQAQSAHAILIENKDSYMLNICSAADKFMILELCDDIAIDTIVISNFEFFSSTFRIFRVSVSDRYPVKAEKWKTLGTFEARNTREVQAFLVGNPVIWARYLRVEFLTHYGHEYYCPVSLVRVHGTTMLEEYKHDMQSNTMDDDDDNESVLDEKQENASTIDQNSAIQHDFDHSSKDVPVEAIVEQATDTTVNAGETNSMPESTGSSTPHVTPYAPGVVLQILRRLNQRAEMCTPTDAPELSQTANIDNLKAPSDDQHASRASTSSYKPEAAGTKQSPSPLRGSLNTEDSTSNAGLARSSSSYSSKSMSSISQPQPGKSSTNATSLERTKQPTPTSQTQPAVPTIQESFFKSVQKRLQMLEANSSLSLQYIEEQSRSLRDAFGKVEQRQLAKTSAFLEYLNATVLNELREFRQQYDELWQSTVIELELQRERYQRENMAINARIGILADEVIFQKRMALLQLVLILICLGVVIFSRGSMNYLEIPLVQSMLSRSPSSKYQNVFNLESPSQSPPPTRPTSSRLPSLRNGILKAHRRMQSDDSMDSSIRSPSEMYSPMPLSNEEISDPEQNNEHALMDDPDFDPSSIERPSTSPPTLISTASSLASDLDSIMNEHSLPPHSLEEAEMKPVQPQILLETPTPQAQKHLTWELPEGR